MKSSTDKKRLEPKAKVISYEEYLQLKKSYISLREKNKKLKEEKQKIESILKEYQKHITDYKNANKTIKMLLQKIESNYKDLKLTKEEKNILLKAKKSDFENEINNIQEETFKKTLRDMRDNNEIITNEYNNTINRYIEVINQLKREIQLKEELYKNNNKANTIIVEKPNNSINTMNSSFKNLVISSNTCELDIIQEMNETENDNNNDNDNDNNNENETNNNFNDKLFISSNICEVNIIQESSKNKKLQLDISSNICEINVLKEEIPKIFLNELISVCSNTCEINIISKEKEEEEEENKMSVNNKFFENLEIIPNNVELSFIPDKKEKNQNLEILSNICEINIISSAEKKKDGFTYLSVSKSVNEINIISNKTADNNQELTIVSKINEINILVDPSKKKPSISQNENKKEQITKNLEISSNICEINIIQKKEQIFNISQNEHFEFVEVRKRKKEKKIKTDKAIFQSYINTLNIGFDNGQEYDNYNMINKEKDEDSDNENDRLECEPMPSFILCLQKKENQKKERTKKANKK